MKNKKRCYITALCLGLSLLLSACGSGSKSMRLRKAEGTVKINNTRDKELKLKENLKLYSGYNVRTKLDSYAWVDLDSVKLTKLDQDSRAEIIKDGKDLTIELISGSIFFNVTEPLKDNESMDIRTSTLAIGIRGTCGWVEVSEDDDTAWVYLLEGKVECTAGDESVRVEAGEMATITGDGELVVEEFDASAIPDFVQSEADEDEDVDKMIQKVSDSGGSSAPKGSGTASKGSENTPKESGSASGGNDSEPQGSASASNQGGAGSVPGFIPWNQAGLTDHAMDWQDTAVESRMKSETGIRDRAIMLSDVWERKNLRLDTALISNISALGELKNLQDLSLIMNDISDISALGSLTNLTELSLKFNKINNISALGSLTNLTALYLRENKISDISALGSLTNLTSLDLCDNQISDISVLGSLTNLTSLNLSDNQISDISVLGSLTNLTFLSISGNQISDISVLGSLKNLQKLYLYGNPITDYTPINFVPNVVN